MGKFSPQENLVGQGGCVEWRKLAVNELSAHLFSEAGHDTTMDRPGKAQLLIGV
jgi:hypothetical protein